MSESFQLQFEPAIGPLTYGLMGRLMRAHREAGRGDQRKNTQKYPQSHPHYCRQAASGEPCASGIFEKPTGFKNFIYTK